MKKILFLLLSLALCLTLTSCGSKDREMPEATNSTEELTSNLIIEQKFVNKTENIKEIAIVFSRLYFLEDDCNIKIDLLDNSKVLASLTINADDIEGDHRTYIVPNNPIKGYKGKELELRISTDSTAGTGLSLMYSDNSNESFMIGNDKVEGSICFSITGE